MKNLIVFSLFLTLIVICLGAYTRLAEAGLGCPDWPGCYGKNIPSSQKNIVFEGKIIENDSKKAWIEMIHRYAAGLLGLIILLIFIKNFKNKNINTIILSSVLLLIVLLQAILGMLTVTMKLQPLIVCLHLLGGFSILVLLFSILKTNITIKKQEFINTFHFLNSNYFYFGCFALFILVCQIFLGGWVSANYAAPFCNGFPLCDNNEQFSISSVYKIEFIHDSYQYGVMNFQSRMSIHLLHRFMAFITVFFITSLTLLLLFKIHVTAIKNACLLVLTLLIAQVSLGISLIFFQFPLHIALLHNLLAASLLISLINLLFELKNRSINAALAISR